jgi:aryl-alcohol dehydrogenase-like predicted oxidoreductase
VLSGNGMIRARPGTSPVAHLEENAAAAGVKLTAAELAALG